MTQADRSAPTVPSPETLRRAQAYWQQGQADLKEARRHRRARAHLESAYFSFQAAVNALVSVCYLEGHYQVPTHSVLRLTGLLQGHDERFAALQAAAESLEGAQQLNPFAAERDAAQEQAQARLYYDQSAAILDAVRAYLKVHRKRYFSP